MASKIKLRQILEFIKSLSKIVRYVYIFEPPYSMSCLREIPGNTNINIIGLEKIKIVQEEKREK